MSGQKLNANTIIALSMVSIWLLAAGCNPSGAKIYSYHKLYFYDTTPEEMLAQLKNRLHN